MKELCCEEELSEAELVDKRDLEEHVEMVEEPVDRLKPVLLLTFKIVSRDTMKLQKILQTLFE